MGGEDQIMRTRMDLNITHQTHIGYLIFHTEPLGAAIDRGKQSHLRANEKKIFIYQILFHFMRKARELTTMKKGPGFSHIGRFRYIGFMISIHVIFKTYINRLLVETGGLNTTNPGLRRHPTTGIIR